MLFLFAYLYYTAEGAKPQEQAQKRPGARRFRKFPGKISV
jgi:hypothetical protein